MILAELGVPMTPGTGVAMPAPADPGFATMLGAMPGGAAAATPALPGEVPVAEMPGARGAALEAKLSTSTLLTTAAPETPALPGTPVAEVVPQPVAAPEAATPQPETPKPAKTIKAAGAPQAPAPELAPAEAVDAQPAQPEAAVEAGKPRTAPTAETLPDAPADLAAQPAGTDPLAPLVAMMAPVVQPEARAPRAAAAPASVKAAPIAATGTAVEAAPAPVATREPRAVAVEGDAPTTDAAAAEPAPAFADALRATASKDAAPVAPRPIDAPADPAPARAAAPAAPAHAPAPAEPVLPARAGQLGRALGVEVARSVANGEESLRVRLNPQELGRVEVTLNFDDGGSLRATVRAESPAALDLLRREQADLGRALDQAGVRADTQSFRFESRSDQGGGNQWARDQRQPGSASRFAGSDDSQTALPAEAYRPVRASGRVDLLA